MGYLPPAREHELSIARPLGTGMHTILSRSAPMKDFFHKAAQAAANLVGSPLAFAVAVAAVMMWAVTGPLFGFSDTWQLVINTTTTIVTFLVVFLVQNTQNRDAKVIQLKLDELIRVNAAARNRLVDLEDLSEDEIQRLENEFRKLRQSVR
jgi:low affinity Fe/Cu permease